MANTHTHTHTHTHPPTHSWIGNGLLKSGIRRGWGYVTSAQAAPSSSPLHLPLSSLCDDLNADKRNLPSGSMSLDRSVSVAWVGSSQMIVIKRWLYEQLLTVRKPRICRITRVGTKKHRRSICERYLDESSKRRRAYHLINQRPVSTCLLSTCVRIMTDELQENSLNVSNFFLLLIILNYDDQKW